MTILELENLAKLGASLVIDADGMKPLTLESLAKKCAGSGAKLYIKNAHKLTALTLESIAKAGSGCVTFDFTD